QAHRGKPAGDGWLLNPTDRQAAEPQEPDHGKSLCGDRRPGEAGHDRRHCEADAVKQRTVKRGLYVRVTETTETDEELRASLEKGRDQLSTFIADARHGAAKIVKDAGIDPDTLFQQE